MRLWHASPSLLEDIEPRLDPRTRINGIFTAPIKECAFIYAILTNRAKSEVATITQRGKFIQGWADYAGDILARGYLYKICVEDKYAIVYNGAVVLRSKVRPISISEIFYSQVIQAGWVIKRIAEQN